MRGIRAGVVAIVLFAGSSIEVAATAQVYRTDAPGVSSPRLLQKAVPDYPFEASAKGIEGRVHLEGIVTVDGTVGAVRVIRSSRVGIGFEEAAIQCVRKWRFEPARKGNRPVAVLANLVVEFVHGGAWSPLGDRLGASVVRQENDPGVFPPIVLTSVPLEYTEQARRARIEGLVTVEVVVDVEGAVREARVVRSIDALHGLDEAALTAARRWTFEPGTVNGRPVPVSVTLVLEFRLH